MTHHTVTLSESERVSKREILRYAQNDKKKRDSSLRSEWQGWDTLHAAYALVGMTSKGGWDTLHSVTNVTAVGMTLKKCYIVIPTEALKVRSGANLLKILT